MPKILPPGKVGLFIYISPETKEFLKQVVKTSRLEKGRFRSMGVLIEEMISDLHNVSKDLK